MTGTKSKDYAVYKLNLERLGNLMETENIEDLNNLVLLLRNNIAEKTGNNKMGRVTKDGSFTVGNAWISRALKGLGFKITDGVLAKWEKGDSLHDDDRLAQLRKAMKILFGLEDSKIALLSEKEQIIAKNITDKLDNLPQAGKEELKKAESAKNEFTLNKTQFTIDVNNLESPVKSDIMQALRMNLKNAARKGNVAGGGMSKIANFLEMPEVTIKKYSLFEKPTLPISKTDTLIRDKFFDKLAEMLDIPKDIQKTFHNAPEIRDIIVNKKYASTMDRYLEKGQGTRSVLATIGNIRQQLRLDEHKHGPLLDDKRQGLQELKELLLNHDDIKIGAGFNSEERYRRSDLQQQLATKIIEKAAKIYPEIIAASESKLTQR